MSRRVRTPLSIGVNVTMVCAFFSCPQVNFKPTPRPYTGARIELPPPRDPLVFAREELASYMAFARALPHNWHYKTCTPVTNGILGLKNG